MTKQIITAEMVRAGHTASWCYSDAFKDLNGFRPRGDYFNSPEFEADFWNTFDAALEAKQEEERQELLGWGEHYGQEFKTWTDYYNFLDSKQEAEWAEAEAKRLEEEAIRAEFNRRGSPAPIIDSWEHGDRLAA